MKPKAVTPVDSPNKKPRTARARARARARPSSCAAAAQRRRVRRVLERLAERSGAEHRRGRSSGCVPRPAAREHPSRSASMRAVSSARRCRADTPWRVRTPVRLGARSSPETSSSRAAGPGARRRRGSRRQGPVAGEGAAASSSAARATTVAPPSSRSSRRAAAKAQCSASIAPARRCSSSRLRQPVGRPAALGGVAFVPWGGQYVSAIDIESGDAVGRLLMRDLVSHALDAGTSLYFGEKALVRFDEKSFVRRLEPGQSLRVLAARAARKARLARKRTQRRSTLDRTARAKIRVYAAARSARRSHRSRQRRLCRNVLPRRLRHRRGRRAARFGPTHLPGDALGGAAAASGFVFCDTTGKVRLYDAHGRRGPRARPRRAAHRLQRRGERPRGREGQAARLARRAGRRRRSTISIRTWRRPRTS